MAEIGQCIGHFRLGGKVGKILKTELNNSREKRQNESAKRER